MTNDFNNTVLVDLAFFESRRQVGEGFLEKLIAVFGQEAPKLVKKIKKTAEAGHQKELAELGHKLKGMCLNVGAERLSEMGKDIEFSAKENKQERLNNLIESLDMTLQETLTELGRSL